MRGLAKKKKGFAMLEGMITSLVVIGILLIVGLSIMGDARDTTTSGTAEYNASGEVIDAMGTIPGWLSIVVLAGVAVVLLMLVYMIRRK